MQRSSSSDQPRGRELALFLAKPGHRALSHRHARTNLGGQFAIRKRGASLILTEFTHERGKMPMTSCVPVSVVCRCFVRFLIHGKSDVSKNFPRRRLCPRNACMCGVFWATSCVCDVGYFWGFVWGYYSHFPYIWCPIWGFRKRVDKERGKCADDLFWSLLLVFCFCPFCRFCVVLRIEFPQIFPPQFVLFCRFLSIFLFPSHNLAFFADLFVLRIEFPQIFFWGRCVERWLLWSTPLLCCVRGFRVFLLFLLVDGWRHWWSSLFWLYCVSYSHLI